MEPEWGSALVGGHLRSHDALRASTEGCHPTEMCSCRNLLAGGDLTLQACGLEKTRRQIFPFISLSRQESQDICPLYFMSRKPIAEGCLLGDLCFMKFMLGCREAGWGAGNDSSVFLPSAALIVCNDLISSTKQGS